MIFIYGILNFVFFINNFELLMILNYGFINNEELLINKRYFC